MDGRTDRHEANMLVGTTACATLYDSFEFFAEIASVLFEW